MKFFNRIVKAVAGKKTPQPTAEEVKDLREIVVLGSNSDFVNKYIKEITGKDHFDDEKNGLIIADNGTRVFNYDSKSVRFDARTPYEGESPIILLIDADNDWPAEHLDTHLADAYNNDENTPTVNQVEKLIKETESRFNKDRPVFAIVASSGGKPRIESDHPELQDLLESKGVTQLKSGNPKDIIREASKLYDPEDTYAMNSRKPGF